MSIQHSVGLGGVNNRTDVTFIQNYLKKHGSPLLSVDGIVGHKTIEAIRAFQKTFMVAPDGLISVRGITERHLLARASTRDSQLHKISAQPIDMSGPLTVPRGQFTFNAEGTDNPHSLSFSRVLCCPGYTSGVTIGRGYDMSQRSKHDIFTDLTQANIADQIASIMSEGSFLIGASAMRFVHKYKEICGVITRTQQVNLFNKTYPFYYNDAKRVYNKYKSSEGCAWEKLNSRILTILVDMRFQGVFNYSQVPFFEKNEIPSIIFLIANSKLKAYEKGRNRIEYLQNGVAQ